MYQSFVTMATPENNSKIDFPVDRAPAQALHCGDKFWSKICWKQRPSGARTFSRDSTRDFMLLKFVNWQK